MRDGVEVLRKVKENEYSEHSIIDGLPHNLEHTYESCLGTVASTKTGLARQEETVSLKVSGELVVDKIAWLKSRVISKFD